MIPPAGGGRQLLNRPWINFQGEYAWTFYFNNKASFSLHHHPNAIVLVGFRVLSFFGTAFRPVRGVQDDSRSTMRFGQGMNVRK